MMSRLSYLFFFFLSLTIIACGDSSAVVETDSSQDEELKAINSTISKDTSAAGPYYDRAAYYYKNSLYKLALKDIDRALDRDSTDVNYWMMKAELLLEDNESRDAIELLETAVQRFPTSDAVRIKLAHFQFIVKQYLPALTNLNEVIKRSPQNPDAYFERGQIYDEVGDTANAIKNYQRVTELNADHRDAWLGMGDILFFQGNEVAVQLYKNAIAIDPEYEGAYLSIANFYHQHDKLDLAKEEYLKIIESFPDYPPAFFNLGILYLEQDSIDKAYNYFNKTLDVNPTNGNAFLYRGICHRVSGDTESARNDFMEAQKYLPMDDNRPALELEALQ